MAYTKSEYIERFGYEKWLEWSQHRKEYLKNYYSQNKDKILEQQKEYSNRPENREKQRQRNRRYRSNNAEKIAEYMNKPENREKAKARAKQWYEDHKNYANQRNAEYAKNNPEIRKKSQGNYRKNHKDRIKAYENSMVGRAVRQATAYRVTDREHGRGESTITYEYILEHIYTQPCVYCGETSWKMLGCDRINNDLPHTPENCVCSCRSCNTKRGKKDYYEFLRSCISRNLSVSLDKTWNVSQ